MSKLNSATSFHEGFCKPNISEHVKVCCAQQITRNQIMCTLDYKKTQTRTIVLCFVLQTHKQRAEGLLI